MFELNEKIKNLTPYDPIEGQYPIRLDANESFVTLSKEMKAEIAAEITNTHFNRYPDPYANEVRAGFAKYFGVPQECVMAGSGSDEVISVLMNAFLQKGDTVVTVSPDFSMYAFYATLVECKVVTVPKKKDYTIDTDLLIETANRENARLIVFSNPCNPTGRVLKKEEVRRLITSVKSLVVLDEAYMDFSDQSLLAEFSQYDNLLILKTCSKAIGMASVRLGFAVGQKRLIRVLQAVKFPYNLNALTQTVGTVIFSHPEYIKSALQRILESRDELYRALLKIEEEFPQEFHPIPTDANFVYVECKDAAGIFDFLKEKGIVVRKMGDCLRITAGRNYENDAVTEHIAAYLKGERV